MEVNENVSLPGAKKFVDEEIAKVSESWVNHQVNLKAFEKRQETTEPTLEDIATHAEIEKAMDKKKDKQKIYFLENLEEDKRKVHQEVEEFNRIDEAIEQNKKGIKECEELLEIMQEVKKELI